MVSPLTMDTAYKARTSVSTCFHISATFLVKSANFLTRYHPNHINIAETPAVCISEWEKALESPKNKIVLINKGNSIGQRM